MPNTLIHLAVQGSLTRSIDPRSDIRLAFLGGVIPDVPWILQRILNWCDAGIDPYELRLYFIGQASLSSSILLAGGIAVFMRDSRRTMLILSFGCLLHLLLDAAEIKWGNGVHLLAPINWSMTSFNLFWPDSVTAVVATALAGFYVAIAFRSARSRPAPVLQITFLRAAYACIFLAAYAFLPIIYSASIEHANAHYIGELRNTNTRSGRFVEFDRATITRTKTGSVLTAFDEEFSVNGIPLHENATVSVQATFTSSTELHAHRYHVHIPYVRDTSTIAGLLVVLILVAGMIRDLPTNKPHPLAATDQDVNRR